MEVVAARVGEEQLAVPLRHVERVFRAAAVTPFPDLPAPLIGAVNFQGQLVGVADIGYALGKSPSPVQPHQQFLLIQTGRRLLFLVFSAVTHVLALAESDLEEAARIGSPSHQFAGVAILPDGLIVVLDPERFLSPDEEDRLDAALAQHG